MYERPFLRHHSGAFVEVAPISAYRTRQTHVLVRQRRTWPRAISAIAVLAPITLGVLSGHPVIGGLLTAAALLVVGLLAFGNSILDGTIELY